MHTIEVTRKFATDDACFDYLEKMRWPNGVCCVKCGLTGEDEKTNKPQIMKFTTNETTRTRVSKKTGKERIVRVPARRLYECKGCGYQFSLKVGTIFEYAHLPLDKWFATIALMLEAKKGISAMQVCRHLGIDPIKNYKPVWYLCHRIREAMIEAGLLTGLVEVDTTWLSPRKPRKGNPKRKKQDVDAVLGMVERGGRLKLVPVKDEKVVILEPVMRKHLHPDAFLQTDMAIAFDRVSRLIPLRGHRMINHILRYAEGPNHTQCVENAFSLLKRGIYGTYHKVSTKHLSRYCEEFSFRFNRRNQQKQMFDATVKRLLRTKPIRYKTLTASAEVSEPSNPSSQSF